MAQTSRKLTDAVPAAVCSFPAYARFAYFPFGLPSPNIYLSTVARVSL